jgi:hypothetical protein
MEHFWRMLECIFVLIVVPSICIWALFDNLYQSLGHEFHLSFVYILYFSWALDFRTRVHKGFEVASMASKPMYEDMNKVGNWQPYGCWALSRIRTKMIFCIYLILNKPMCNVTPKLIHQMVTIIFQFELLKPPINTH